MDVKDILIEIQELEEANSNLRKENDNLILELEFLKRQNNALKLRCSKYSLELTELHSEIQDMKFTHKMLNSEEAGRAFARELLGKPMSETDIAEEEFIANGEAHYNKFAFIGDDF